MWELNHQNEIRHAATYAGTSILLLQILLIPQVLIGGGVIDNLVNYPIVGLMFLSVGYICIWAYRNCFIEVISFLRTIRIFLIFSVIFFVFYILESNLLIPLIGQSLVLEDAISKIIIESISGVVASVVVGTVYYFLLVYSDK